MRKKHVSIASSPFEQAEDTGFMESAFTVSSILAVWQNQSASYNSQLVWQVSHCYRHCCLVSCPLEVTDHWRNSEAREPLVSRPAPFLSTNASTSLNCNSSDTRSIYGAFCRIQRSKDEAVFFRPLCQKYSQPFSLS